jgi:hypothetical protein
MIGAQADSSKDGLCGTESVMGLAVTRRRAGYRQRRSRLRSGPHGSRSLCGPKGSLTVATEDDGDVWWGRLDGLLPCGVTLSQVLESGGLGFPPLAPGWPEFGVFRAAYLDCAASGAACRPGNGAVQIRAAADGEPYSTPLRGATRFTGPGR